MGRHECRLYSHRSFDDGADFLNQLLYERHRARRSPDLEQRRFHLSLQGFQWDRTTQCCESQCWSISNSSGGKARFSDYIRFSVNTRFPMAMKFLTICAVVLCTVFLSSQTSSIGPAVAPSACPAPPTVS